MSDYTQITSFGPKDSLATGNPAKLIKGTEVDPEFAAISAAILTKYDTDDLASQAEAEAGTNNTKLMTPLRAQQLDTVSIAAFAAAATFTGTTIISSTAPILRLTETDAAADNKIWQLTATGEALKLQALTDALAATTILNVERTAGVIDAITMAGGDFTYTTNSGAAYSFQNTAAGVIGISGTAPEYRLTETDGAADEKVWTVRVTGGSMNLQTRDDALGLGTVAAQLTRAGITPVSFRVAPSTSVTDVPLGWTTDANTGINRPAADQLGLIVGGVQRLFIGPTVTYNGDLGDVEIGTRRVVRQTTGGTLTAAMVGSCQSVSASVTVNASVFAAGDALSIYNDSAASITITQGTIATMRLAGTTTTGSRTLAARGLATLWFNGAGEVIVGGPGVS